MRPGSTPAASRFDAVIIGAGAAGLHCAGMAGQRGLRVLLIDHADKVAEKIRISGGGRCNFTNRDTAPANFLSSNPPFCRSALARYTAGDFLALVQRHGIGWHEKHKGQLFCDDSSDDIVQMLLRECAAGGVVRWQGCAVHAVRTSGQRYEIDTGRDTVSAPNLVIATGGLSIPQIGASDFGYRIARQFGVPLVDTRPGLVPLTFDAARWAPYAALAGLSLPVRIATGQGRRRAEFAEDLLFTHRGLSGPAVLQISNYWQAGEPLQVDLAPDQAVAKLLLAAKATSRRKLVNELADVLPHRLAQAWLAPHAEWADRPLAEVRDRDLARLADSIVQWQVTPSGSEGYRKAEVTAGGVDTRALSSQRMECLRHRGLFFIGEVVDVTGWLGGYNFQWAWSSAAACARALAPEATASAGDLTSP